MYEISREPLNGFAPNSRRRRVWYLARMSLNVKVKGQRSRSPGTKKRPFRPFRRPACGLCNLCSEKHLQPLATDLIILLLRISMSDCRLCLYLLKISLCAASHRIALHYIVLCCIACVGNKVYSSQCLDSSKWEASTPKKAVFTARRICMVQCMLRPLSVTFVCPSVTSRCSVKTAEPPHDNPRLYSFLTP